MKSYSTFLVFLQLLRRDVYAFGKRLTNYGINSFFITPFCSIVVFGYLQSSIYFGEHKIQSGIVLIVGSLTFNMILLCYNFLTPFLYDLETERFIDFQLLQIKPRWLLFEMILFPALLSILLSLPFFALAALLLPGYFAHLNTHWLGLSIMIIASSLFASSYMMLSLCLIDKARNIRRFWLRVNWPLVVLGGLWIPWHLLKKFSPTLAYIDLANPILYITEGIRSALIGSDQFISYQICIFALLLFFCIFSVLAGYFFKRKMDHI